MTTLLTEYKNHLQTQHFTPQTIQSYTSRLRQYIKDHNIQSKKELKTVIKSEQRTPRGLAQVYSWLNVLKPPRKGSKHKTHKTHKTTKSIEPIDDPLIQQFFKERGLRPSTFQGYTSSLKLYLPMCGFTSAEEMIKEALEDEKNHVPIKEARITQHLRDWKIYLQDYPTIKTAHTLHTYFTKIETFYRHFNVTVPQRPPMSIKSEYHVTYYDLPDKQMIETAIDQSDLQLKAIIYFMSSSGTAKAETLSITVGKFIDSLRDYTTQKDPQTVVNELHGRRDIIPVISLTRIKTNVPYYTCCSSEATYYILEYMKQHNRYKREEPLWSMNSTMIMKRFSTLNDNNQWGRIGPYRRFRTHTLRKFHASNLGCSFDIINTLEGRTNGTIHETYVKQKPEQIKKVYMEYMHNVMIHPELFEGPHCGNNTLTSKIHQEVERVTGGVPVQTAQSVVQNTDMNVYKELGKLEARIEMLEQRLKKLED